MVIPEGYNYYDHIFKKHWQYVSDGFDYPVGKPNAKGYYIARGFGQARHLGDDWNAVTGGNSDLGDPIYAISNGYVSFSLDLMGGWGNTIRIVHKTVDGEYLESLYSHCDEIFVEEGQLVKRGDKIGTIGTAHGMYTAHLHLELRTQVDMELGGGYADEPPPGYTDPKAFIERNRPRW